MRLLLLLAFVLPIAAQVNPKTQVCPATGTCATVDTNGLEVQGAGTAGTAAGGVMTVQGSASGTAIPVTVSSVPSNQSVNVAQVGGTATDTNSGNKSAGTQRIVFATDQPQNTNAFKVDGSAVTQPVSISGNQNVNINQVGGATPDPCFGLLRTPFSISQTGNAQIITGVSAKKIYICSIWVVVPDAESITLVAGTGSICGTTTVAVLGFPAATAANGAAFAANGGFATNGGGGMMGATTVNADNVCLFQSGSGRVAGGGTFVAQ